MKIDELYRKITADENLRKKFTSALKEGKLADFLTENGCTATAEEIKAFIDGKKELTDDELDAVSGGGCFDDPFKGVTDIMKGAVETVPIGPITPATPDTGDATETNENEMMYSPPRKML